jgi:hypothetical protein
VCVWALARAFVCVCGVCLWYVCVRARVWCVCLCGVCVCVVCGVCVVCVWCECVSNMAPCEQHVLKLTELLSS